ncbi:MAG: Nucleotidyltransferase domain protein [Tenericutes bacterium ADurb.BinA155]|jgi:predicted nucleotidyltransferase|nr:MAG: Nucleotidyltransferase domain protein [Tenericutes bacterium ADurb.BinA155]
MESLKELRKTCLLTQAEVAAGAHMPLRTYKNYENDPKKQGSIKYLYLRDYLLKLNRLDESHGVLSREAIARLSGPIFKRYGVSFAYLFGSYARKEAKETSDIDFLVSPLSSGLSYFALAEELRESLHKKIDLLDTWQLNDNPELLNNVLKDGVRIDREQ